MKLRYPFLFLLLIVPPVIASYVRLPRVRPDIRRPPEFVGRWVHLRDDGTWGDTVVYLADGHVRGSVGHVVPDTTRWDVIRHSNTEGFCIVGAAGADCQPYRLIGDTMTVGQIEHVKFYRRAP